MALSRERAIRGCIVLRDFFGEHVDRWEHLRRTLKRSRKYQGHSDFDPKIYDMFRRAEKAKVCIEAIDAWLAFESEDR